MKQILVASILFFLIISSISIGLAGCSKTPPNAYLGEQLVVGGTAFQLDHIDTVESLTFGRAPFGRSKVYLNDSSQIFVEVALAITNLKDSSEHIDKRTISFIGGDGKEYSSLDELMESVLDADDSTEISHIFFVKRSVVRGGAIKVRDPFSGLSGTIYLKKR